MAGACGAATARPDAQVAQAALSPAWCVAGCKEIEANRKTDSRQPSSPFTPLE